MNLLKARYAIKTDLPQINRLIELAVMNWPMAHRVKRRATPVLQYDETDLEFLKVHVATIKGEIVGVAA